MLETRRPYAVDDVGGLKRDLEPVGELPRQEAVALVKQLRTRESERIARLQIETINEITGLDVAVALTGVTDLLVDALIDRACAKAEVSEDLWQRCAVLALGGYGRAELAPGSDIDLLVVALDAPIPEALRTMNAELQTLLWDVGFDVGASMRALPELDRIIRNDFVTASALLDRRSLRGEAAVGEAVSHAVERLRRKATVPFLRHHVEAITVRRQETGDSLYALEPDIKSNPGGLRDMQFLRHAANVIYGEANLHRLRDLGVMSREDIQRLYGVNDHLLGLRALLHFRHGRKQDVLRLTDQVFLAEQLGYAPGAHLRGVEHMMRRHYAGVREVDRMVRLSMSRMLDLGKLGRRRIAIKTRRRVDAHFSAVNNLVYLRDRELWTQPGLFARLMAMFRTAQRRSLRVSLELQREISRNLHRLSSEDRRCPRSASLFREVLGDIGRVRPILGDMHASGLLGAYLPEFGGTTCLMQFNSYHAYTVDEHTLIAIGLLDALARNEDPGRGHLSRVLAEAPHPDLLVLGLLLHDAGKVMGGGHAERGALMVRRVAARLGLGDEEEDLVYMLVAQHLILSDASRMRDIHDPRLVCELANAVGSADRLELLYLLTNCDMRAVGPHTVARWQEQLLDDLFATVHAHLRDEPVPSRRQALRRALEHAGIAGEQAAVFLDSAPENYPYQVDTDEVVTHYRLLEQAREAGFAVATTVRADALELTCAMRDATMLLADLAGAITARGYNVTGARTWTTGTGLALHGYTLTHPVPGRVEEEEATRTLAESMRRAVAEGFDPAAITRGPRFISAQGSPADSGFDTVEVRHDQELTPGVTVFDVAVKDRPGILTRLCRLIGQRGLGIAFARVFIQGDISRDVLYVHRDDAALDPAEASALDAEIRRALSAQDDPDGIAGSYSF